MATSSDNNGAPLFDNMRKLITLIDELKDDQLKKEFAGNVDILNRVWYGGMSLDDKKYEAFSHYFLNFQAKISLKFLSSFWLLIGL